MKQKIITALKTKYQRFGLSNEAIDRIASAKEKTVNKEEDIEAAVADVETMNLIAQEVMKMRDGEIQRRTDLQKTFDTYKESHPEKKEDDHADDEPEWARTLREQMQATNERLDRADKDSKAKAALASVVAAARKKFSHEKAFRLTEREFSVKEDESEEDALKRFEEAYNANKKEFFSDGVIPPFGSGDASDDEQAFKSRLSSYADAKFGAKKD